MTRAWLVTLFGAAAGAACNSPDVVPPSQLNLDRPVDISFACYGPLLDINTGTAVASAQPRRWCDAYSPVLAPPPDALGPPLPTPAPGLDLTLAPTSYVWYGFILQPVSGTVALAKFPAKPSSSFLSAASSADPAADVQVIDTDRGTPGKNALSVGENPIAIGTDLAGCKEIVANAGSCDLSVIDINTTVASSQGDGSAVISRMAVMQTPTKALRARAAAMVIQPSDPTRDITAACPAVTAGTSLTSSGLAYIAYPSCNLVAGVNLATGLIEQGIQFQGTVPTILSTTDIAALSCIAECDGYQATAGDATSLRPVTLDLKVDARGGTQRLAIGANNSSVVTVVDLDANFVFKPAPLQIALEDKDPLHKLGVTTVVLTPQIAMGNSTSGRRRNNNLDVPANPLSTTPATVPDLVGDAAVAHDEINASAGGEGQYVYAVATDGTVRVADVLKVNRECDTQVDMRFVRAIAAVAANVPRLQCFPVGDAATPPRRPGARGPGIELPVDGAPTSVAIIQGLGRPGVHQDTVQVDPACVSTTDAACDTMPVTLENDPDPSTLVGFFAVVSTSSGQSFIVNVDDDDGPDVFDPANPQATSPVLLMAHQLRDGFGARGATVDPAATVDRCTASDPALPLTGGPRSSATPTVNVAANTFGVDATQASKAFELPNLLKEQCSFPGATTTTGDVPAFDGTISELQLGAGLGVGTGLRDEVYPDLRATITQSWSLSWEGPLSTDTLLNAIDGPAIRSAQMRIDGDGMHLIDDSRPFCDAGVEPFDIVQMRGCNPINGNNECPANYTCFVQENNLVPGLGACMLTSEASRLSDACKDFLTSARRYTVARADSGELTLYPRKHVLATTPIDGCTSAAQCSTLAAYELSLRDARPPFVALKNPDGTPLTDTHAWTCAVDDQRAPVNGDPAAKRCIETCAKPEDCDVGTICIGPDGKTATDERPVVGGTCMESVVPSQSCVNGPQRFDLRASEAFTLIGTSTGNSTKVASSGYVHSIVEQGTGADPHACVKRVTPGSVDISRIPLTAPACDPSADPATGALAAGGFEPNPCSKTVTQAYDQPNYKPVGADLCALDATTPTTGQTRTDVPAIKIRTRNATLTLVDPYSPGDQVCVGDRLGVTGIDPAKIPQLIPPTFDSTNWFDYSYKLTFDQHAGYLPLALSPVQVIPALPVKVVRGPSDSVWIMDDGDVLAVTTTQSSTKGQVYRVEMQALSTVNTLQ